jgi:GrpB-like predicted nucleotidyltransferase (UPF0157 family)
VPYDHDWPRQFESERRVLQRLLAPWLAGGVQHVGSTAVPGLSGKPTIDMIAGVSDLNQARAAGPPLQGAGYLPGVHRPAEALWFYRTTGPQVWDHTHHLHLTEVDSDLWRERLAFRDALRADAALRAQYQTMKQQMAAARRPDTPAYLAAHKRAFVAAVLATAGITLPPRPTPPTPQT